eukprot:s3944_g6.t1
MPSSRLKPIRAGGYGNSRHAIMALRKLGHTDVYITPQDVYNLRLLVQLTRETTFAELMLPFLGFRILSSSCSVAACMDSMYAIDESGQLHFFGLGRKALPPDLGPVVAVAAGLEHTAALRATGELLCFGANHWGECDVPQDLGRILSVAVGDFHTCALKATGELTCFGKNEDGQCDVPGDLGPVVAIAAGAYHTCAVNSRCELVCFGKNDCGQCDAPPDIGPVAVVAAGAYYTCVVRAGVASWSVSE